MTKIRSALVLLGCFLAIPAFAENPNWPNPAATRSELLDPANWPDDPGFGFDPANLARDSGAWSLWSFTPPHVAGQLTAREEAMGVGMHADRAWQLTTGRFDVSIAVMDSGFRWSERELVNKWRLNAAELPMPQGAVAHDANGDGRFNVQDYTSATGHETPIAATITDTRLSDTNGNGILDPQDLIAAFSDGIDDDQNGYIDDICGWDFMWDDNDAFDDVGNGGQGYSHGTGMARDAAAEGNNGMGGIGVCPDCSVIPLRVSDSFVADVNHFALATVYAVDNGASVILEALGSINATPFMQQAIDYAWDSGVLVVASAADETSFHHNYPGSAERTLYVHAIVYDTDPGSWVDASTFLNFNNCTNYGGHLALSTPGEGCSSEATGLSGGHAGMMYSMARDVGLSPPLSANEAYQLMTVSADDIDVDGSENDPTKFFSDVGWDHHFGYGRNNVRTTVEMLRDGAIPPEAEITSPLWFETLDGSRGFVVEGYAAARRAAGTFSYKVEIAPGVAPRAGEWTTLEERSGLTTALAGVLTTVDPSALGGFASFAGPPSSPHQFAATLRLTVTADGLSGEFRKSIFIHRDDTLLPGFPLWIGASGESSPRLVDLDGDGVDEIVVAFADGRVHVMRGDGTALPGWPVTVNPIPAVTAHAAAAGLAGILGAQWAESIVGTVSVGDLEGDGTQDVVVTTLDGSVYVFDADGLPRQGFPVTIDPANSSWTGERPSPLATPGDPAVDIRVLEYGIFASPVLVDLDSDGDLEIIVAAMDGFLYVWGHDGLPHPGFPVEVTDPDGAKYEGRTEYRRERMLSTPAVGDMDGDGSPEIVLGSGEVYQGGFGNAARGYAIWGDGNDHAGGPILPGWPVGLCCFADILPYVGRGVPTSPAMADLDEFPGVEVIVHTSLAPPTAFNFRGERVVSGRTAVEGTGNASGGLALIPINSGSFGDLDGDGFPEYINGCISLEAAAGASGGTRADFDHMVCVWSMDTGEFLPGFPAVVEDFQFFNNYVIADVDGDGLAETISGSGGYLVNAFDMNGDQASGFPKHTGGWVIATPALGDLDGDGFIDIVVGTRDGWLWAWSTTGPADSIQWEAFHHDPQGTGNLDHPLRTRPGPPDAGDPPKKGCGCGTADGSPGTFFGLALLLAALRRRH